MSLHVGGTVPESMWWDGQVEAVYVGAELVWSASPYPVSGEWQSALTSTAQTFATHTIAEAGTYTITQTVTGGGQFVQASIRGPWGVTAGNAGPPSTATTTQTLEAGDLVEFRAVALVPSGTATGTWSITKH